MATERAKGTGIPAQLDKLSLNLQTLQQLPAALTALTASCTSALGALQSVLPLQHAAEEVCQDLVHHSTVVESDAGQR